MFDALIWDGHMILADIFSIETLPPYNILIQYIHRCYSSPDNPKETPSRIYITSPENQQSNQNYSTHSSMEERETEDQSPGINFVDSVSLDTPSFEPLTPVDIINEKVDTEGNISQNFSGEPESVLDLVEENQSFKMNSVENLPEESIITEDHSFRIDNPYFPECLSQSEWEFQSILSKTSSLNLLETINPLHYMPEEAFLTKSEDQDYISPSLIPSSPAFTKALEISTSESVKEENHVQKDPGKSLEPIIKSNSISQQESSCDPIHLPEFGTNGKDLQFVKPPGKSLNILGLEVDVVLVLTKMKRYVIGISSLQLDCSLGPGYGFKRAKSKMEVTGCLNILNAYVCGEEESAERCERKEKLIRVLLTIAGIVAMSLAPTSLVFLPIFEKSQATIPNGTTFHTQVFNSGRSVVSQSSPSIIVRRHESHRQPSAPAVKSGRAEQSSFWTSLWKRDDEQECEDNHDCLLPAKAHLQPGLPGPRFGSEIKNKLLMMIVIAASDFLLKIRL
ncbi:hypothetical protein KEM48_004367 [Puccinia striiformis f. sp. tritici PST-130]|nr:hypothetical protein KEM48_004367 [Puccinia striiformis f. sp. tritici PST-130]